MIDATEAKRIATRIRRGTNTHDEQIAYDRWARATKGPRKRKTLAELHADRRAREAAEDLLKPNPRAPLHDLDRKTEMYEAEASAAPSYAFYETTKPSTEPPIAPPLPGLDGEIVEEPIAPPVDLGEAPAPGFDLGGGVAKAARAALEALDARNPEIGGIALATVFGASFWPAWEAAATRLVAKHVGAVQLADEEMVVAGAAVVVGQPIAIPFVKEHGAEWLAKIKKAVGFGAKS